MSQLMDAAQRGESVSLEDTCAEHPELADELRELWGFAMLADAAGDVDATDAEKEGVAEPFKAKSGSTRITPELSQKKLRTPTVGSCGSAVQSQVFVVPL